MCGTFNTCSEHGQISEAVCTITKKIHTSEEKKPNIICIYTCTLCDSRDDSLFKHLFNTETRHTQNIKWDWGFFFKKTKGNRNEITIILSSQILKMN